MGYFLFSVAFDWRVLPAVALLGFLLGSVRARPVRLGLGILLVLGPILLVFLSGAIGGCRPFGAEDCMLGFGVVMAFWWCGAWLLATVAGLMIRYAINRRR